MTTFQPGDVVRLTGGAWPGELRGTGHAISGISRDGNPWFEDAKGAHWYVIGDWTAELVTPATLSPQAVLDAICGVSFSIGDATWREYRIEGYADDLNLTARKVDGHWQVKNVGGAE